jgi:hypothetical protein
MVVMKGHETVPRLVEINIMGKNIEEEQRPKRKKQSNRKYRRSLFCGVGLK